MCIATVWKLKKKKSTTPFNPAVKTSDVLRVRIQTIQGKPKYFIRIVWSQKTPPKSWLWCILRIRIQRKAVAAASINSMKEQMPHLVLLCSKLTMTNRYIWKQKLNRLASINRCWTWSRHLRSIIRFTRSEKLIEKKQVRKILNTK